jgi:flagellum-specific peptidoglycan hydrolase FlgJ
MNEKIKNFIQKYYSDIKRIADENGINFIIILTHAIHESGYGESRLVELANNFFGIKAKPGEPYVELPTWEQDPKTGEIHRIIAKFKKYPSVADSIRDVIRIYKLPRYKEAWENRNNPKEFFKGLQRGGYATDVRYASKLVKLYNQVVDNLVELGYIDKSQAVYV